MTCRRHCALTIGILNTYCLQEMKTKPPRNLTITIEDAVHGELHKIVGRRHISRFLNDLARPHVVRDRLEEGYRAMAADEAREAEAAEWSEGLVGDVGLCLFPAINCPGKRALQRK
jgi:hypothetical protein